MPKVLFIHNLPRFFMDIADKAYNLLTIGIIFSQHVYLMQENRLR